MHRVEGGGVGRQSFVGIQVAEEGVGRELGMQLPAHAEGAGLDHQVRFRAVDGVADVPLAQFRQVFAFGRDGRRTVLEDQVRDQHGAGQRGRRAGVEFIVEPVTEWVFFQFGENQARVHGGIRRRLLRCKRW
ncbi:hypothetical protein SDC9_147581 [bioreactor metagenome]|uniref:Uncharacterized protein n=1 Tax=bioreactor metagenome TaxID=1076179 RepID=A0A645EF37_9ZZZZ